MTMTDKKQNQKICEATLRVAADGWDKVTLERIAKASKISLTEIKNKFAAPRDVLPLIVDYITATSFASCGKIDKKASAHDRLFDILMARFDVLQPHRRAIRSITESARKAPQIGLRMAPAEFQAMKKTMKFAGVEAQKTCAGLQVAGLLGVFCFTCFVWWNDETLDMSKTMAALDRALRMAHRAATLLRVGFA